MTGRKSVSCEAVWHLEKMGTVHFFPARRPAYPKTVMKAILCVSCKNRDSVNFLGGRRVPEGLERGKGSVAAHVSGEKSWA